MSETLFIIDKIEGNSNIGVPVFSRQAYRQNFEFLALSPRKKLKITEKAQPQTILDSEMDRFRVV
jgi:hypothetical protein